jgi:sigma-B regulation protein RsbU (phosphoserine phosphatase)
MGTNAIRILIVEDSANDTALLLAELGRKGHTPTHQRVETKDEFLSALKNNSWDAVISDYVLPQFSGPEALRLLRHKGFEVPFIMVSGIYGEEEAVSVMKAGANDYVMKRNLSRLAPALERELQAAQDRHRRKRAEGAMQFLAAIVESSVDAIYGKSLDGRVVSWNPAAEMLFGYSAEEIIGQSYARLIPEHRRSEMLDIQAGIRRGDVFGEMETERLHKGGRILPVAVTVSPVRNNGGEIIGASSIARDISRQKQAEHERQHLMESLQAAARQVQSLSGLLPICARCKRIRDDQGYWQQVEAYISKHSAATFSHGICPACAEQYEREFELKKK